MKPRLVVGPIFKGQGSQKSRKDGNCPLLRLSIAGLLSFLCGAGNFGKFWSACERQEIQFIK
jgi:hypothetical protein